MSKGNEIYCGFMGAISRARNEAIKREKQEQLELENRRMQVLTNISNNIANAIQQHPDYNKKPIVIENLTINIIVDKNKGS